jgi:hypothetical protein
MQSNTLHFSAHNFCFTLLELAAGKTSLRRSSSYKDPARAITDNNHWVHLDSYKVCSHADVQWCYGGQVRTRAGSSKDELLRRLMLPFISTA